jgi:hypothetical protein
MVRAGGSTVLPLIGGLLLASMPMFAHHSFMAEFGQRQPVTVDGVVTAVKWQNPHTFFYVDVKEGTARP